MNGVKNYKIIGAAMMLLIGFTFEGLRHFQFHSQQDEIGRAGDLYAVTHETAPHLEKKNLRRPRAEQIKKIQKISAPRGVRFDLKAAIADYQKEHGLELTKDGARKRPDKLKADSKKAKKKKNSKYEYVFDMKRGRWVKRLKLTAEQKEALLAKKQAELLEKMKQKKEKATGWEGDSNTSNNRQILITREQTSEDTTKKTGTDSSKDQKNELKSYSYWKPLLLNGQPNPEAIDKLIKAYQAQPPQVSTQDFYKIADELVHQQSLPMKEEGLSLIDAFPSFQSFRILAHMVYEETDSTLSEKIQTIMMEDYTTLAGLHILSKVLNPHEDEQVLLAATQQLNLTMEKVLSGGGDPSSYASNFTQFASLLQSLTSLGGEVSTQATRTLALLQSSFNIQTVASNTPDGV